MNDVAQKVENARAHLEVDWTEERARRVENSMILRRTRIRRVRTTSAVILSAVALVALSLEAPRLVSSLRSSSPVAVQSSANRAAEQAIVLSDGSTATPIGVESVVHLSGDGPSRVEMEVAQGTARFSVTPNPSRLFIVRTGVVTVQVVGTAFTVERVGQGANISVHQGRVKVSWSQQATELSAGEAGSFPRDSAPTPALPEVRDLELVTDAGASSQAVETGGLKGPLAPAKSWRDYARDGHYDEAFATLQQVGTSAVRNDVGDLLLAADVARLSHHPEKAVDPLTRIVQRHGQDPRASLAAFTLGRVLLDELGGPRQAASAFAQARQLAPGGTLAQDALAREVEAWSRAGEQNRALSMAEEYVKLYPNGRRIRAVRRFGNLN